MKKRQWTEAEDVSLVHGYLNGEPILFIEKRLHVSRSTLYRRLGELGIPAREPLKKSEYTIRIKPYPKASPLVAEMFKRVRVEQISLTNLARRSGVVRETIGRWGQGWDPLVHNLEAVGNCVGLTLRWVNVSDD